MDDLGAFCCQNSDCPDVGKRGHGNLTVTMRYGPDTSRRLLRCSTCKARFSERKGTPLFAARLHPKTATAVLAHIAEGIGTVVSMAALKAAKFGWYLPYTLRRLMNRQRRSIRFRFGE
jgi:hypothetical protein